MPLVLPLANAAGASGVSPSMRMWLLVLVLALAAERSADAACACLPKVSPEAGSIPLRGSLYLGDVYLLEHGEVSVRWMGAPGSATWSVHDGAARLDYSGPDGSELLIITFKQYELARYKLDAGWRAPAESPRAIRVEHQQSRWTCASTDALLIKLDQSTAAVRVRWTHSGKTQSRILATDGTVALGQVGCCGSNISTDELHHGGELDLVALRVDGTEAPILGLPSFVSSDMYSLERGGGLRTIMRPVVAASYHAAGQPFSNEPVVPQWLKLLLSLGLIGSLLYISQRAA